jgi:hemerythrin-like domain-containing protein
LVECNFNFENTISIVAGSNDPEISERVDAKVQTFLNNIEQDIKKTENNDFEIIKRKLASKYKNLPSRFHHYLDETIKWKISVSDK